MATYVLLDGTTAAIDFAAKLTPTSASAESYKCIASYLSMLLRRSTNQKATFCSGGWATPTAGMRAGFIHLDGFQSTGGPISDPLALFSQDLPCDFTFTAHTGCAYTGKLLETQNQDGSRALAESGRGIDFETYGVVSTTWVVA